ncbi:MAG: hypothetical protein Q9M13_10195 [Mariprofundales bacterium]|nr:hypothetical protein [Mariprofundales bacterium]
MSRDDDQVAALSVWRRQMRVSGAAVAVGVLLLSYTIPQLRHSGDEHLAGSLVVLSVLGGLAVLGGAFSCALALFFHLWHQRRED